MKKNRKIVGIAAVMAVMVSLLVVSVPADKEQKENTSDCGCDCNRASTEGKLLNFNELLEKTKGWGEDVVLLEKEIEVKREELLELYKSEDKNAINKIEKLRSKIEGLESKYRYKKGALFEIEILQRYTEVQRDGTLSIARERMPEIQSLDLKLSKMKNTMAMIGEEKMMKDYVIYQLLELLEKRQYSNKKTIWQKIETLQKEKLELETEYYSVREKYLQLRLIQNLKKNKGSTLKKICLTSNCPPQTPNLTPGYHWFENFEQEFVWIGVYDTVEPNMNSMIGEFCDVIFTTDMNRYWQIALNNFENCRSIQVKWFYHAVDIGDNQKHDIIWEGNKNRWRQWWSYDPYNDTYPNNGLYAISVFEHLECCNHWGEWNWCNTHCGHCWCCDPSAAQYFVQDS